MLTKKKHLLDSDPCLGMLLMLFCRLYKLGERGGTVFGKNARNMTPRIARTKRLLRIARRGIRVRVLRGMRIRYSRNTRNSRNTIVAGDVYPRLLRFYIPARRRLVRFSFSSIHLPSLLLVVVRDVRCYLRPALRPCPRSCATYRPPPPLHPCRASAPHASDAPQRLPLRTFVHPRHSSTPSTRHPPLPTPAPLAPLHPFT